MSLPLKVGLGCVGAVGVSGASYLGFKQFYSESKESFKSKYSLAVKDFLSNDIVVNKKLDSLSKSNIDPKYPDLVTAKTHKKANRDNDAKSFFEKGCKDIHSKSIDSGFFDDFKNYCSFNNEDKIQTGKSLVAANGDFDSKWTSFNQKSADQLQKGFKSLNKPANSVADDTWKGAMLKECKELSTEIFEGEIANFTEFCTK